MFGTICPQCNEEGKKVNVRRVRKDGKKVEKNGQRLYRCKQCNTKYAV